jgi:hypothetical protein
VSHRPIAACYAADKQYERATHSISLLDADHLFYGNVSHGGARFPAQLQDASDRQANDDESADKHTERY